MEKQNLLVVFALVAVVIPVGSFLFTRSIAEDKVRDPEITVIEHPRNEIQLGALTGELSPEVAERLIQDPDHQDPYAKAMASGQE